MRRFEFLDMAFSWLVAVDYYFYFCSLFERFDKYGKQVCVTVNSDCFGFNERMGESFFTKRIVGGNN